MAYALITGASSGIGHELAKRFARDGHNVILVARSEEALLDVQREIEADYGVEAVVLAQDLAKKDAALRLHERTAAAGLRVDFLVNNAGFGDCAPFLDADWQKQSDMAQLNMAALMHMTYLYASDMRRRGFGRVLNLASVAACSGGPYMSVYYASKAFVLSFSEALSEELRGTGVTVTALCPGPTQTRFEKTADLQASRMFSLFRPASASDVAEYGYRKMMCGKALAYYGGAVKAMFLGARIAPRALSRKFARYVNGRKP
ncbi:MAG TPA: SDR family oxidoreductase [Candidatus Aphodomonas merdavium]|nr:SDR family oxidoreductase [Candidatus Aphodomonas merdavium]